MSFEKHYFQVPINYITLQALLLVSKMHGTKNCDVWDSGNFITETRSSMMSLLRDTALASIWGSNYTDDLPLWPSISGQFSPGIHQGVVCSCIMLPHSSSCGAA